MRTLASLLVLAIAPALASAQATLSELKKLAKAGVSDDVILAYLRVHGFERNPSSDDLVELKEAGISDRVLAELVEPSGESPAVESPAERTGYLSGTLSVSMPRYYPASYSYPAYRRYYTGVLGRGVASRGYGRPLRVCFSRCR